MGTVGVFDCNEGNIGEFFIGPCEGDAPFGNTGVGIDGISAGAVQFVVMERMKGQQIFFGGMVKDEEPFLGFIDADITQLSGLFLGQVVAAEDLFREWIGEAFDHRGTL
jgi:hypothetical protein